MTLDLNNILGGILSEENTTVINQALEAKIEQVREQAKQAAEQELRSEFESKYNEVKDELVETLGVFIDENLKKELLQYNEMKKELNAERLNVSKQISESRNFYKQKLKEHIALLEQFHNTVLVKEIKELKESFNNKIRQKNSEIEQLQEQYKLLNKEKIALSEERIQLIKNKQSLNADYQLKLKEHCDLLDQKLEQALKEHVVSLEEQRLELVRERNALNEHLAQTQTKLKNDLEHRVTTLDKFVLENLEIELRGLKKDKDALDSARVKLVAEGEKQITELKKKFISESSKKILEFVDFNMKKQLTELKEDIETSRKNDFGRRMFDAFIEEYLESNLGKNSSILKMQSVLENKNQELDSLKKSLVESQQQIKTINENYQAILNKSERTAELQRLLSPLNRDQKKIMEQLLSNHETKYLKEAFDRYWPRVENVGFEKKPTVVEKQTIAESVISESNGFRHDNRLATSIKAEADKENISNSQVNNILKLARIINGAKQ